MKYATIALPFYCKCGFYTDRYVLIKLSFMPFMLIQEQPAG